MDNLEIMPAEEGAYPSGRMALGLGLTQYDVVAFDAKRPNERDVVAAELGQALLRDLWRADSGKREFYPILTAMPSKQSLLNNHTGGSPRHLLVCDLNFCYGAGEEKANIKTVNTFEMRIVALFL